MSSLNSGMYSQRSRLWNIRSATEKEKALQLLIISMSQRWPKHKSEIVRDIMCDVICDTLRSDITLAGYTYHIFVLKDDYRARKQLCMDNRIKNYIARCYISRSMDNKQQNETLMLHEVPSKPWAKVGTDPFMLDYKDNFITVDYFSNIQEVDNLADTKSTTVMNKWKAHFACQGIPDFSNFRRRPMLHVPGPPKIQQTVGISACDFITQLPTE